MMASNILSRLLPSGTDAQSVYGEMPPTDDDQRSDTDLEDHDMDLDEQNLGERFHDQDIEQMLAEAAQSEISTAESAAFLPPPVTSNQPTRSSAKQAKWMRDIPGRRTGRMEEEDEVPHSLLLETGGKKKKGDKRHRRSTAGSGQDRLPSPVPGPSSRTTRAHWEATREQQPLYKSFLQPSQSRGPRRKVKNGIFIADPKERALWRWANVQNLDKFLDEVYRYYIDKGIWSVLLSRVIKLASTAFVVGFSTFLTMCVNYSQIPKKTKLEDVIIQQCTKKMSGGWNFLLWISCLAWIWMFFLCILDVQRLWNMHNFYHHLLDIPDSEIQTVSWQLVVRRLMTLRDANPATADISPESRKYLRDQSKQRMDAHDIANRLMRRENYLIAMFNKDILDVSVPIPFIGNRQFVSNTIMWSIGFCILDFAFQEDGSLSPTMLDPKQRHHLVAALRKRMRFAGVLNTLTAPFVVTYFLASNFFRSFTEYHRNPSELGSRSFTTLAEWKFREFNELWHLFRQRKNMAYPFATRYLEQFPKDKTVQVYNFVAFIAGALAAVLGLASLWDSELFLGFEITPGKTVLFWLGILGSIYSAARAAVPEEHLVFDPEFAMNQVIQFTRYCPANWKGRLHSDEVRREFSALYQLKIVNGLEELLSIIFLPYIVFVSLPNSIERVVDFFREFTIHIDGVGHVCSFAVFDFKKSPTDNLARARPNDLREDWHADQNNKLMYSFATFLDTYHDETVKKGNQKRGMQKSRFLPPPTFPGLVSPQLNAEPNMASSKHGGSPAAMRRSTYQTPRFDAVPEEQLEPMHSILLDPHHQPRYQSRPPNRGPHHDPDALEEVEEDILHLPRTTSAVLDEDSELGDSWRTTRPMNEEEDEQARPGEQAGVLGLLAQFSKATTERGATGAL